MTDETKLTPEVFRILGFEARAFCRLGFVAFQPDGSVVTISGDNAQGKSSVLRAVDCALRGKSVDPETPIRAGETSSDVKILVGPNGDPRFSIERRYDGKGSKLVIRDANGGEKVSRPSALLADLIDSMTFDPAEFMAAGGAKTPAARAKRQVEMLLDVCPVDVDLDGNAAQRQEAYEARTANNRQLKGQEALLAAAPEHFQLPEAVDAGVLIEEQALCVRLVTKASELTEISENEQKAIDAGNAEAERLRVSMTEVLEEVEAASRRRIEAESELSTIDVDAVKEQGRALTLKLNGLTELAVERGRMEAENKQKHQLKMFCAKLRGTTEKLTHKIETLDKARHDAIAAAKFPVEGLGLNEDGVTFNGVAFSQASHAEQLKVSLGIAMAKSPQLRVAIIRDGNAFDQASMDVLRAMAEEHDFQVWVERVSQDQPGSIVIEDGEVAG